MRDTKESQVVASRRVTRCFIMSPRLLNNIKEVKEVIGKKGDGAMGERDGEMGERLLEMDVLKVNIMFINKRKFNVVFINKTKIKCRIY